MNKIQRAALLLIISGVAFLYYGDDARAISSASDCGGQTEVICAGPSLLCGSDAAADMACKDFCGPEWSYVLESCETEGPPCGEDADRLICARGPGGGVG